MPRKFIITDIHGCAATFEKLVVEVLQIKTDDELYLLGDYIDRGVNSKGVIDLIFDLRDTGHQVHCLRGNHEEFLLLAKDNLREFQHWMVHNGGETTLKSFGVETVKQIPEKYLRFFNDLPYFFEVDNFLLVHAGFNFSSHSPFEDTEAMIMIRNFKIDHEVLAGRKIIHGHTPTRLAQIRANIENPEAVEFNLDAGCVYTHVPDLGHLVALELNEWKLTTIRCIDGESTNEL